MGEHARGRWEMGHLTSQQATAQADLAAKSAANHPGTNEPRKRGVLGEESWDQCCPTGWLPADLVTDLALLYFCGRAELL